MWVTPSTLSVESVAGSRTNGAFVVTLMCIVDLLRRSSWAAFGGHEANGSIASLEGCPRRKKMEGANYETMSRRRIVITDETQGGAAVHIISTVVARM